MRDNCRAIELLLREGTPGEIYNVGSGIELANIDVARQVLDAVGASEYFVEFVDDRPGHDQRYALATVKIAALGCEPQWTFDEGLAETVEYYLS